MLRTEPGSAPGSVPGSAPGSVPGSAPGSEDERAVERYRYLLRTAPPERIEQAHAEAFAALTPEQRREVLQSLSEQAPPGEQPASDEPRALARAATRAEMRSPGILERTFGSRGGGGLGMGGVIGGSLLGSVAGAFIGSAIAHEMFDEGGGGDTADGGDGGDGDGGGDGGAQEPLGQDVAADETRYGDVDGTESGWDGGGDFGGGDVGGGDF